MVGVYIWSVLSPPTGEMGYTLNNCKRHFDPPKAERSLIFIAEISPPLADSFEMTKNYL